VIAQIMVLDIVFSLDSVITAIGMADHLPVMIAAVVIAVLVMMAAAGSISRFVEDHPTVKMLALSFLLLVGMSLVADGFGQHISKGYIYFAMGFSVFVEMLNLRMAGAAGGRVRRRPAGDGGAFLGTVVPELPGGIRPRDRLGEISRGQSRVKVVFINIWHKGEDPAPRSPPRASARSRTCSCSRIPIPRAARRTA
jgi:hypothetical protein